MAAPLLGRKDAAAGEGTGLRGIAAWAEETQEEAAAPLRPEDAGLGFRKPGLPSEPTPLAEEPGQAGSSGERGRRVIMDSDDQDAQPVRLADAFGLGGLGAAQELDLGGDETADPSSMELGADVHSPTAADAHSAEYEPRPGEARDSLHPAQPPAHVQATAGVAARQQVACLPGRTVQQVAGEADAQQMLGQQVQGRRRTEAERLRPFYFDEWALAPPSPLKHCPHLACCKDIQHDLLLFLQVP